MFYKAYKSDFRMFYIAYKSDFRMFYIAYKSGVCCVEFILYIYMFKYIYNIYVMCQASML